MGKFSHLKKTGRGKTPLKKWFAWQRPGGFRNLGSEKTLIIKFMIVLLLGCGSVEGVMKEYQ